MSRLVTLAILLGLSQIGFGQKTGLPHLQCGYDLVEPLITPINVLAKPLGKLGRVRLPTVIDGDTLAFSEHTAYTFEVLIRIEGFCPDTLVLPVKNENDSLLQASVVLLEVAKDYSWNFAALSKHDSHQPDIRKHIKQVHGDGHSFIGEVERVSTVVEQFYLSNYGIEVPFDDSSSYGYDTAAVKDVYFEIKMKTVKGQKTFYAREAEMLGTDIFQIREIYLFRYHELDGKKWIDLNNLYQKDYHIEEYFDAYEQLR